MRNILFLLAGLVAGLAIGFVALDGSPEGGVEAELAAPQDVIGWKVTGAVPASLVQIGTLAERATELITELSGGRLHAQFYDPGALVPVMEMFDSVSTGAIDAGIATAGYWVGKEPALAFFSAVPFGPNTGEYMAWFYYGGGKPIYDEIYARHNMKGVMCGIIPPEASGWFREEITSLEDLRGLKMRFFGLGGEALERLGVSTQLIAGSDIYPALELGTIDATEFSMPAIDLALGFHQIAKHYYFPGWHQQSTFLELMINMERWQALPDDLKLLVETVCGESIRLSIAEGDALQFKAIAALKEQGVSVHRWPPEILAAFEAAWHEVVAERSAENEDFARVWQSLKAFREDYAVWLELGYL
jgi:TRAP-type mannitol/chloroaromatic compound transport system substrate-binding protein